MPHPSKMLEPISRDAVGPGDVLYFPASFTASGNFKQAEFWEAPEHVAELAEDQSLPPVCFRYTGLFAASRVTERFQKCAVVVRQWIGVDGDYRPGVLEEFGDT